MGKIQYPLSKLNIPQFEVLSKKRNFKEFGLSIPAKPLNAAAMNE